MNPLTGIWVPRGDAFCYRAASPSGDGRWFAATKTHSIAHPPAVPCPLTPVRWIFTFSAKEKDTETGFSYFGSRYYNSDLSIWLNVDPISDKYPSLSPYVYCADNPIKLVDPSGEEISEHIDKYGNIIAHYDDGDNNVYLHKSGTTWYNSIGMEAAKSERK